MTTTESIEKTESILLSFESLPDLIGRIRQGEAVAVMNGPVGALIGDGANTHFAESYIEIKGKSRQGKPISGFFTWDALSTFTNGNPVCDPNQVPYWMNQMINFPAEFRRRKGPIFGTISFLRFPASTYLAEIAPSVMVSANPVGITIFQNWDPTGTPMLKQISTKLTDEGMWPAITSLNTSGSPVISELRDAEDFCRENRIPLYVPPEQISGNPGKGKGSYTIIEVDSQRLSLRRRGNIPLEVILEILDDDAYIDTANSTPLDAGQHPHEIPNQILSFHSSRKKWAALMAFFQGKDSLTIQEKLSRSKI